MPLPSRPLSPALPFAILLALPAGCASTSSTAAHQAATASTAVTAAAGTPAATGRGTVPSSGAKVYFAEGGDVNGTVVYKPDCATGCQLSGDSTTSLWNMTWPTWTSAEAVGAGTEKIDDCTPDCAAGTLHAVRVIVTFTEPVEAGCAAVTRLYWTRASFTWPDGLPAVLSGQNAPLNPFTYPGLSHTGACA